VDRKTPKRLGNWRLIRRIADGTTAQIFLGEHVVLETAGAVKVLRPQILRDRPEYTERFLREAKMAAGLLHPNIARVFDCGVEGHYHYMVMDYVDGPNCLQKLAEEGAFPWRDATVVVRQVADGLACAARQGIIHRDVKPSNIMIGSSGHAVLCDLGLARLMTKGKSGLTQELRTVGTPAYMSPEQISSAADMDLRADVYSLGATFYHLVCGGAPFDEVNPMRVVVRHLTEPLTPPLERNADLPAALSAIICKMMAKLPEDRYQDYESLRRDLDDLLEGRQVLTTGFSDAGAYVVDEAELQEALEAIRRGPDREHGREEGPEARRQTVHAGTGTARRYTRQDRLASQELRRLDRQRLMRMSGGRDVRKIILIAMGVGILAAMLVLALALGFLLGSRERPSSPAAGNSAAEEMPRGPRGRATRRPAGGRTGAAKPGSSRSARGVGA